MPTRLGLVRLRRGGSENQHQALAAMAAGVAGVSSVRLLAPPEVSVRQAVLGDRRRRGRGSNPSPLQAVQAGSRACCAHTERTRAT